MLQSGNTDSSTLEAMSQSQLVELSVVAAPGQDQIGEDMKNFAEQLRPYPYNIEEVSIGTRFIKFESLLLNQLFTRSSPYLCSPY